MDLTNSSFFGLNPINIPEIRDYSEAEKNLNYLRQNLFKDTRKI